MFHPKLFLIVFLSFLISSCGSEETLTPEQENQRIEAYITSKKLTVTEKTTSGLRYILTKANASGAKVGNGQTTRKFCQMNLSSSTYTIYIKEQVPGAVTVDQAIAIVCCLCPNS